jgi:hypothetical protein
MIRCGLFVNCYPKYVVISLVILDHFEDMTHHSISDWHTNGRIGRWMLMPTPMPCQCHEEAETSKAILSTRHALCVCLSRMNQWICVKFVFQELEDLAVCERERECL